MVTVKTKRAILHADFAKRFNQVCDDNPMIPPYNYGRLRWVKDELESRFKVKVSPETVRKWLAGESKPRTDKMRLLAELLGVDVGWLSFGSEPDLSPSERMDRALSTNGAINIVSGFIIMAGGSCALPDEGEDIDILGILSGKQLRIEVAYMASAGAKLEFRVSKAYRKHKVIAVVQTSSVSVEMFQVPTGIIEQAGDEGVEWVDLECTYGRGSIHLGGKTIGHISDIKSAMLA